MLKSIVTTILLTVSISFAATIKDVMKNELKPNFKIVVDSARKGEITADTKTAALKIEAAFMSIKDQVPEYIPKGNDVVKPTPEDIMKYKTYMNDMIILTKPSLQTVSRLSKKWRIKCTSMPVLLTIFLNASKN